MASEVTHTRTKDRILTDAVYKSPVDQQEMRMRRVIGLVILGIIVLLLAALIL